MGLDDIINGKTTISHFYVQWLTFSSLNDQNSGTGETTLKLHKKEKMLWEKQE